MLRKLVAFRGGQVLSRVRFETPGNTCIVTREQIFQWIADTLVDDFEVDRASISLDAHLVDDLDLDSLDAIDMLVRLQEIVQERIDEDNVRKVRTVRDVVDLAEPYLSAIPALR